MLGLDEEHVREVPQSDAHRLATSGTPEARFDRVEPEGGDRIDRVEVIDAGDRCVVRYRGVLHGVRVVDREALPQLAEFLLGDEEGSRWTVETPGQRPGWLADYR